MTPFFMRQSAAAKFFSYLCPTHVEYNTIMTLRVIIILLLLFLSRHYTVHGQTGSSLTYVAEKNMYVTQGFIEVGLGSLYYEELGEGEPVILLHGHALSNKMWDTQFFELSNHYRVIRYDLRGYGSSSSQIEFFHFTHVADLVELMNALNIDKAHLIGLSLGGNVIADLLGEHPERVKSAVMVSGNISLSPGPSQQISKAEFAKREKEVARQRKRGEEQVRQEYFEKLFKTGGSKVDSIREHLWEMICAWDAWQPMHHEVRLLLGLDAYEKIKENKPDTPVLIVEGKSKKNRYPAAPEILNYLPNGKLIEFSDCGQIINMEQPEAFNQLIQSFLVVSK